MFTIPYIETREEFFYLDVFLKLLLGLLAIALVINKSGKGNLAPTSAMDQVQNYVLGGIIGGGFIVLPLHSSSLPLSWLFGHFLL